MKMRAAVIGVLVLLVMAGCSSGGDEATNTPLPPSAQGSYQVVAWNDLGMHCLNPSYDTAVILPPYNTVWAQVIKRGNPPQVITSGVTVSYRIVNNTTSQGKGLFSQFWQYAQTLFGAQPALDKGLNLDDPGVSNGLSGTMLAKADHFVVSGIPVVPYNDGSSTRNPYQTAEITVTDGNGTVLAKTLTTVPTSEEINCGKCHAPGGSQTQVFNDILAKHDASHHTNLLNQKPVLCAKCHGSPALGAMTAGSSGLFLSQAIHGFHAGLSTQPACYDCHPGQSTQCNRSAAHTAADGGCTNCHGTLANVASSVGSGRVPWVSEPKCVTCHNVNASGTTGTTAIPQVDTGTALYRNSKGHGGVYCAGCHGSPHAMFPVSTASADKTGQNYPAQYQPKSMTLGDCRNCHSNSRGGGTNFAGEHASRTSACNICHTGFQNASNTANFPHGFQWKRR